MALVAVDVCPVGDAWGDVCWEERQAVDMFGVQPVIAVGVVLGMMVLDPFVAAEGLGRWCLARNVAGEQSGLD